MLIIRCLNYNIFCNSLIYIILALILWGGGFLTPRSVGAAGKPVETPEIDANSLS